jgi:hypothetical protein
MFGPPGSGKSCISKIVVGDVVNRDNVVINVSDMYENIQIKQLLDKYYTVIGADVRGQSPLPDTKKMNIPKSTKAISCIFICPLEYLAHAKRIICPP